MKGIPLPVVVVAVLFLLQFLSSMEWDEGIMEDLPFFAAVGAFILFRIFSSQTDKKRRGPVPMPMPEPETQGKKRDLGFKIPPLKGAPKTAQTEAQAAQTAEEDDEALDALRRDSYERHLAEKQEREKRMEEERLVRERQRREVRAAESNAGRFSPDMLRNAVVWSEIIAPPKALRKRVKS